MVDKSDKSCDGIVRTSASALDVHIGKRIRSRRDDRGISQDTLAHLCEKPVDELRAIELGVRRANPELLAKISSCLSICVTYFFLDYQTATSPENASTSPSTVADPDFSQMFRSDPEE